MPNTTEEFFQRDRTLQPPGYTPGYKTSVLRSPKLALWSLQTRYRRRLGRYSARTSWVRSITT